MNRQTRLALATALAVTSLSTTAPLPGSVAGAFVTRVNAQSIAPPPNAAEALRQQMGDQVQIEYQSETGLARLVSAEGDHLIPLTRDGAKTPEGAETSPEAAARLFMQSYGALFGIANASAELKTERVRSLDEGTANQRSFTRFQQLMQGVPVFGGDVIVQTRPGGVVMASGQTLPNAALEATPRIPSAEAQKTALGLIAKHHGVPADQLAVSTPALWVYNAKLFKQERDLTQLVWRMEVTAGDEDAIRELVLIDAHTGKIALNFNQVENLKKRVIFDKNNNGASPGLPGTSPVRNEGQGATGIADVDAAYDLTGLTYDYYKNNLGRDSIDGKGLTLTSTVRYCPSTNIKLCPYGNAFWNGKQMVFGQGYAGADDVVAHELTHGVTQYESGLYYFGQSGAINEALSDIFGELMDLTTPRGNDTAAARWLLGEDLPIGALRDGQDPGNPPPGPDPNNPNPPGPDKMSSANYFCGPGDNAGVHYNSTIAFKAAYLMTDGDTFNGQTVQALGIPKVQRIWYEVQTNLLSSASQYADLYNAVQRACSNLTGQVGITPADCGEVKKALDAVEMNQQPALCSLAKAPICPANFAPKPLFFDTLENTGSGNWAKGFAVAGSQWYYPQNMHTYANYDATYATSGAYNFFGDDFAERSDSNIAMKNNVTLPVSDTAYFRFNHAFGFDYDTKVADRAYDGGVVEYSLDNGTTWTDVGALPTDRGYNTTLYTEPVAADRNPLAGRRAFGLVSGGYIATRYDLSSLKGKNVRFRFRIGTDSTAGYHGWFVDDISLYTCFDASTLTKSVYLPLALR